MISSNGCPMQADAFPYLRNPFDKAVCGLTPLLMAPLRGTLEPPPLGGYRFVAASLGPDGLTKLHRKL